MEVRAKILHKFRFPYFRETMFFAASTYLRMLREQQVKVKRCLIFLSFHDVSELRSISVYGCAVLLVKVQW